MMTITEQIIKAASVLKAGGLVAFPTETVYGLGADAKNKAACERIFAVKERPHHHPLIVHIATLADLSDWACDVTHSALKLAEAFWPGPLTMIFKKKPQVSEVITGGQDTIGIRIPHHPIAQRLLQTFGSGIAAPSANKFTCVSPTTAEAVIAELGSKVELVLDGGACAVGLESTIVDMSGKKPRILRPGMISADMLSSVLGEVVIYEAQAESGLKVPGMHPLHYAPLTQTSMIDTEKLVALHASLQPDEFPVAFVVHSDINLPSSERTFCVRMAADPKQYAHDLYHVLRSLDCLSYKRILIETVPSDIKWVAIQDRLLKATRERIT